MGMKAPHRHRICNIRALSSHLSVMVTSISSRDTSDSPNSMGKDMKAVKRIIFLSTLNCLSLSSATRASTGCATLLTIPFTVSLPMLFHSLALV